MSVTRSVFRLAASSAVAVVTALIALALAAPAHAADGDVQVRLDGLGSSMTAGSRGDGFTVREQNETESVIDGVRRVIVVRLDGLGADQVSVRRLGFELKKSDNGAGEVRFEDPLAFDLAPDGKPKDSSSANLSIQFAGSAPPGRVTVAAYAVRNNEILGSDSDQINLRAPGGQQNNPTTAPPITTLPPVTVAPPTDGPQSSVEPIKVDSQSNIFDNTSGIPTILYILGAILVGLGGVILWLLMRESKPALPGMPGYDTADYEQVRAPNLGYPTAARHATLTPTTVMPAVRDPRTPPPASDPWARGDHSDRTQEFPGPRR